MAAQTQIERELVQKQSRCRQVPRRQSDVSDLSAPERSGGLHSDPLAGIFTPFRLSRPCGTDRPILYALFRRRAKNSPGYSDGTSIARPVENCKPSALNPALWKAAAPDRAVRHGRPDYLRFVPGKAGFCPGTEAGQAGTENSVPSGLIFPRRSGRKSSGSGRPGCAFR